LVGCAYLVVFVRDHAFFIASGHEPAAGQLFDAVVAALPEVLSFYDSLWVLLALFAAWRWSQPSFP
jgi:hypothetical protein